MGEFREEVKRERTRLPVLEDHLIRVYPHHKAKIQRLMKKLQEQGVIRGNKPYWKVMAEGTEEGVIVLDNESEFAFGVRVCEAFNEGVSVKSEDWIDIDTDVIATALVRGLTTSGFMKRPKEVSLKGWKETILAFYIGDLKRGIGSSIADLASFGLNKVGAAGVEALANEVLEESRIPELSKSRENGTISESDMSTLLDLESKVARREAIQLKGTPKGDAAQAAYEKAYGAELANSVKLTLKEYTQTAQKQGVQLESALKGYVNDEKNALADMLGKKGLSLCLEEGRYVARNGDNEKVAHMYIDKLNCLKEVDRRNDVWLANHKKMTHAIELKLKQDLRVRAEREKQQNKFIQSAKYGWDVACSTLGYMTPKQKRLVAANATVAALGTVSAEQQTALAALSSLHYLFETQEGQKCLGEYLDSKTVKNLRHETTKKMETWARENPTLAPLIQDDILFRNWVTHASVGEMQGALHMAGIAGVGIGLTTAPVLTVASLALAEAGERAALGMGADPEKAMVIGIALGCLNPTKGLQKVGLDASKLITLMESKAVQGLLSITRKPVTIRLEDGTKKVVNQITGVKGCEWHHILSDKNDLIRNHKLLKASGFDLQDSSNLILLPKVEAAAVSTTVRSVHQGRHVEEYSKGLVVEMDRVLKDGQRLNWNQEQYRQGIERIVADTRLKLKNGEIHLNSVTRESLGLPLKKGEK